MMVYKDPRGKVIEVAVTRQAASIVDDGVVHDGRVVLAEVEVVLRSTTVQVVRRGEAAWDRQTT